MKKCYPLLLIALLTDAAYAAADPCSGKAFSPDGDLCVSITAYRHEQPLKYVGSSTTIVTRGEMQRLGIRNVADALKRVPGVAMARTGGYGSTTNIRVRGADSGQVRVLLDGVTINDPSNTENFFDFSTLQTNDIERIEVVRGPQSSLYGADTTGGIINITSRRASPGAPVSNGFAEVGSHDTRRAGVSHYGAQGKVYYGGSVQHYDTKGFSRNVASSERDGSVSTDAKAHVGIHLTEQLEFEVAGGYEDATADFDPSLAVDGPGFQDKEQYYGTAKAIYKQLDGKLKHTAKLDRFHIDRSFDEPLGFYRYSTYEGKRTQAVYQADMALRERDVATLGLDVQKDEAATTTTRLGVTSAGLANDITNKAAFGQYVLALSESWTVTAGGRRDEHNLFGNHATYRFTTAYVIDATDTILRGTYGTGYKAPSIFQLYASGFGNRNLQPEESRAVDAGIEQRLMDGRLRMGVTAFQSEVKNLVTFDNATFTYQNINRAEVEGVESSAGFDISPQLVLSANHTYLNTQDVATGRSLPRRPKHMANVALDYDVSEAARIGGEILYVSSQWDRASGLLRVRPHSTVNFSGSYELNQNFTLYSDLKNIFDKDYQEIVGYQAPGFTAYVGVRATY